MATRRSKDSQVISDIMAAVAATSLKVEDMHHRLFGNGQPGDIDKLHGRISDTNQRVDDLVKLKYWLIGGAAVASVLITGISSLVSFAIALYFKFK